MQWRVLCFVRMQRAVCVCEIFWRVQPEGNVLSCNVDGNAPSFITLSIFSSALSPLQVPAGAAVPFGAFQRKLCAEFKRHPRRFSDSITRGNVVWLAYRYQASVKCPCEGRSLGIDCDRCI